MRPPCNSVAGNDTASQSPCSSELVQIDFSSDDVSTSNDSSDDDDDDVLVVASSSQESSSLKNIIVKNSRNVHCGNRTVYQCPVTISQVVYAVNRDPRDVLEDSLPGLESASEVKIEAGDLSTRKCHTQVDSREDEEILPAKDDLINSTEESLSTRCKLRRRHIGWMLVASFVAILTAVTLVVVRTTRDPSGVPSRGNFRIWQRSDWSAKPNTMDVVALKHPTPYVIIGHTVQPNCRTFSQCAQLVRIAQDLHQSYDWGDIGYSFLVGGDGDAYVGRGWDHQGAHTYDFNHCSIGIAFIGTFISTHPPQRQMDAALLLLAEGVRLGKIRPDYRLIGHSQVSRNRNPSEADPGQALFQDLKKLPHFSEKTSNCVAVGRDMDETLTKYRGVV